MLNSHMLVLPFKHDHSLPEVPKAYRFLSCVSEQKNFNVLIDDGWIDRHTFDELLEYQDSVEEICGRYLPSNLKYCPRSVCGVIKVSWHREKGELEVLTHVSDVHLWMLAVSFFGGGRFLIAPERSFAQDMKTFMKDWVFRKGFVEDGLLDRARRGEFVFRWMVLTTLRSKKSDLRCLVFLAEDSSAVMRMRSCVEKAGLVTYPNLDF